MKISAILLVFAVCNTYAKPKPKLILYPPTTFKINDTKTVDDKVKAVQTYAETGLVQSLAAEDFSNIKTNTDSLIKVLKGIKESLPLYANASHLLNDIETAALDPQYKNRKPFMYTQFMTLRDVLKTITGNFLKESEVLRSVT